MFMKKGFTLAEVLITIGIIGVVAAITIPGLITTYKKHVLETKMKEFYSIFNQSLKLAEADYEDMEGWDYSAGTTKDEDGNIIHRSNITNYEWFQRYLQPYLKTSTVVNKYHLYYVWYDGFGIEFINGTAVSCGTFDGGVQGKLVCMYYPNAEKMRNVKDNTNEANRLIPGKDYFLFEIKHELENKGLRPYNSNSCYQTTGTQYLPSPGCAKLIIDNNWKIPKNYPIKL